MLGLGWTSVDACSCTIVISRDSAGRSAGDDHKSRDLFGGGAEAQVYPERSRPSKMKDRVGWRAGVDCGADCRGFMGGEDGEGTIGRRLLTAESRLTMAHQNAMVFMKVRRGADIRRQPGERVREEFTRLR